MNWSTATKSTSECQLCSYIDIELPPFLCARRGQFYSLPLDGTNQAKSKKVMDMAPVGRWDATGLLMAQELRAQFFKEQKESQELQARTSAMQAPAQVPIGTDVDLLDFTSVIRHKELDEAVQESSGAREFVIRVASHLDSRLLRETERRKEKRKRETNTYSL